MADEEEILSWPNPDFEQRVLRECVICGQKMMIEPDIPEPVCSDECFDVQMKRNRHELSFWKWRKKGGGKNGRH